MMNWLLRLTSRKRSKMNKEATTLNQTVPQLLKESRYRITTFFGELELKSNPLGSGGNAFVYEVISPISAAIKILAEDIKTKRSKKFERFLEEYRKLVVHSHHPGIVRLYHYEQIALGDSLFPVILMEKCDQNLKTWKKQAETDGRITLDFMQKWIRSFCETLKYIHNIGIVHRDIKPENILIRSNGAFILADFGIAWFDPEIHKIDLTTGKERLANFQFSAPEQVPGSSYLEPTAATDIFALGQLVYWMLTDTTIKGINPPSLPKEYESLKTIIHQMTQQNMVKRPQSAEEVLDLLAHFDHDRQESVARRNVINSIQTFSERLAAACPGTKRIRPTVTSYSDPVDIKRIVLQIGENCQEYSLMCHNGPRWFDVKEIRELALIDGTNDGFLIYKYETFISNVWVVRCDSIDHEYAVMKFAPMPDFSVNPENTDRQYINSEAAWFIDRYITRAEFDDGYTLINGNSVPLEDRAQVRLRMLKGGYWIICSKFSAIGIIDQSHHDEIDKLFLSLETVGTIEEGSLLKLNSLQKHWHSAICD
jgi:tRNA A-37 threonylcarbamoyl transferase component Bud32